MFSWNTEICLYFHLQPQEKHGFSCPHFKEKKPQGLNVILCTYLLRDFSSNRTVNFNVRVWILSSHQVGCAFHWDNFQNARVCLTTFYKFFLGQILYENVTKNLAAEARWQTDGPTDVILMYRLLFYCKKKEGVKGNKEREIKLTLKLCGLGI